MMKVMFNDDFALPGKKCSADWHGFLQSVVKDSKTQRHKAKCIFCGDIFEGRLQYLRKHRAACKQSRPSDDTEVDVEAGYVISDMYYEDNDDSNTNILSDLKADESSENPASDQYNDDMIKNGSVDPIDIPKSASPKLLKRKRQTREDEVHPEAFLLQQANNTAEVLNTVDWLKKRRLTLQIQNEELTHYKLQLETRKLELELGLPKSRHTRVL